MRRSLVKAVGWALALLAVALPPAAAQTPKDAADEPLLVVQNGRYGYIDHTGQIVIQPQYLWADDFMQGMATVFLCGRAVSIDRQGNVWPLRMAVGDTLLARDSDGKKGFVDGTGRWRIPPRYEDAMDFSEGWAAVRVNGKWGFIDSSGKEVLPPTFEVAYSYFQGVAIVRFADEYQLIDKSGRVLTRGFEMRSFPTEGLIAVDEQDKSGYLSLDGRLAIPALFDSAEDFSEGLASVRKGHRWGYIDHSGQVVIPLQFDEAREFHQGLASVRQGRRTGFIDKSGKFVFELSFTWASGFVYGDASAFTTDDQQFGYVLSSGKVIWGPTTGSPDHPPLFGWSDEDKEKSCEGVPDLLRQRIASFPPIPRE